MPNGAKKRPHSCFVLTFFARVYICHFATMYLAYVGCYLLNSWIPFDIKVILIFTAIFAVLYLVIWLTVFFTVRATSKRLNAKVK